MKRLFITGTDTDVGKTVVTALIAAYFKEQGKEVIPYKPVQSGAVDIEGKLSAPDVQLYKQILPNLNEEDASTYLLKTPSSPHFAAREDGVQILPEKILQHSKVLDRKYETVLIEGAGGLIVPLQENGYTMLQLIKDLSVPVVLVARTGVGTINHTILSIMVMREAGIQIAGIILNRLTEGDPIIEEDNCRMIEYLADVPLLGVVPHMKNIEEIFNNKDLLNEVLEKVDFEKLKGTE